MLFHNVQGRRFCELQWLASSICEWVSESDWWWSLDSMRACYINRYFSTTFTFKWLHQMHQNFATGAKWQYWLPEKNIMCMGIESIRDPLLYWILEKWAYEKVYTKGKWWGMKRRKWGPLNCKHVAEKASIEKMM